MRRQLRGVMHVNFTRILPGLLTALVAWLLIAGLGLGAALLMIQ